MSIRALYNRKKLWIIIIDSCSFIAIVLGMILEKTNIAVIPAYLFATLLILFTIATIYAHSFAFRCPRCGKNCRALAMQSGPLGVDQESFFSIRADIHCCPFCGVDIDSEIDSDQQIEQLGTRYSEQMNTNIQLPPENGKGSTAIQLPPGEPKDKT